MRAAIYEKYGPPEVVHVADLPKPVPKDNEVLIRIRATTVTTADWRARSLDLPPGFGPLGRLIFGISGPRRKILGTELSGEIEAVGKAVTRFKPGDQVFAYPGLVMGAHAEYRALPETAAIAPKPPNLNHEEAAALCFGGTTALFFFRRAKIKAGETLLVNGATGQTGAALVQLGRHFGARVTAVASTGNLDLARSLGAEEVIDYTREDFTRNGRRYDLIADTAGTVPFARAKGSLKEGGRLLKVLGDMGDLIKGPFQSMGSRKVIGGTGPERADDVRLLGELAAEGKYRAVIDSTYPLADIVAAHARTDTGHKRGAVVVTIG